MKSTGITVASIAKSMKIDPKNARAKLRRSDGLPASCFVSSRKRGGRMIWTVKPSAVPAVKKFLKTDGRKAA